MDPDRRTEKSAVAAPSAPTASDTFAAVASRCASSSSLKHASRCPLAQVSSALAVCTSSRMLVMVLMVMFVVAIEVLV